MLRIPPNSSLTFESSRFTNLINHRMFQLAESGHVVAQVKRVMDNERRRVPLDEGVQYESYDLQAKPINLNAFILLYAFYGVGCILAFISFIIEFSVGDVEIKSHSVYPN